ncbi:MAG: hypothetical protein U1F16_12025 [Turneriella sp.]
MEIQLHKLTNESHRLVVLLNNGNKQSRELETRSFLAHDFAHFALESVAAIETGFWGLLAAGGNLNAAYQTGEFAVPLEIERAAALLQSAFAEKIARDFAINEILKLSIPQVNAETVNLIFRKLGALHGEWKSTPYGAMMQLRWRKVEILPHI